MRFHFIPGEPHLDLQRLKELEKLAGLRLDPQQRNRMLADLVQLEKFASNLPEISSDDQAMAEPETGPLRPPVSLTMDREIEKANAPQRDGGFYHVAPTDNKPSGESS